MTEDDFDRLPKPAQLLVAEAELTNMFSDIRLNLNDILQQPHLFIVTPIAIASDGEDLPTSLRSAILSLPSLNFSAIESLQRAIANVEPCAICVRGRDSLVDAIWSTLVTGATGHELYFGDLNIWWIMSTRL